MKRFAYLRDGLFLVCCSLYALNRWMIRPHTHNVFLRFHFDDLLLMPCALPVLLWLQRGLRLRTSDNPPTWNEIALYTVFWSILFEVIGPHLFRRATGDPWDVVVYILGGIGAGLWWNGTNYFRGEPRMSFDVLAPHYRWMELVCAGEKLQGSRTAHLAHVPAARHILILGEGNGRFLVECHRQYPRAIITVVDASARMIELARKRLSRRGVKADRIDFICADALAWTPPAGTFDLIVTHFFLDCFRQDQLELLIPKLERAAAPNAHWLLADFQTAAAGWRRQRSRVILWLMYRFFIAATRLPARTLTRPDSLLERHGFRLRAREIYDCGLLHSDCWQAVS